MKYYFLKEAWKLNGLKEARTHLTCTQTYDEKSDVAGQENISSEYISVPRIGAGTQKFLLLLNFVFMESPKLKNVNFTNVYNVNCVK